jgi:hypothetical protein
METTRNTRRAHEAASKRVNNTQQAAAFLFHAFELGHSFGNLPLLRSTSPSGGSKEPTNEKRLRESGLGNTC